MFEAISWWIFECFIWIGFAIVCFYIVSILTFAATGKSLLWRIVIFLKRERERREAILRAEGEKKSTILVAEGEKESVILEAEASKQAAILNAEAEKQKRIKEAEGQAEAIRTVQKATADGIEFIKNAGADDAVLTLKSLEAFAKAADGKATKIIIPSELQGIAGLTKTIAEVARADKAE